MNMQSPYSMQSWLPKDYQRRAIQMMLSQGSVGLFLDPGLGKTSIVLAAFKILKRQGFAEKMLIVAPLRPMYSVWPAEIKKWAEFNELTCAILHGDVKEWNLESEADIYIINPEGLAWLYDTKRVRPHFDILCIDESTRFKNSSSKRFKLLKPHIPNFNRRWILTGTPCPNGAEDLFGQIYILDMGRALGRYITHFRNEFFDKGYMQWDWTLRPNAFQEIIERITPLILQLSAEDYLKMPELVYRQIDVTLPPAVRERYSEVEEVFITQLGDGEIVAANAAVAGGKCRQIANGAVYDDLKNIIHVHNEKLEALDSYLEELNGNPTLIFYEFIHDRIRIQERHSEAMDLSSSKNFEKLITDFNAGKLPILMAHPRSAGHGLNLQENCNHVLWFGIPWDLELYDQAIARVYRQGQSKSHVYIYHIVAKDTLDEKVLKILGQKDRTQQSLLRALGVGN